MTVDLRNTSGGDSIPEILANALDGKLLQKWGESFISFNNHYGNGKVELISFEGGLTSVVYKATFREPTTFSMIFVDSPPLEFVYLTEGSMEYERRSSNPIKNNQNLIISYIPDKEYNFTFPAEEYIEMHITQILPQIYLHKKNANITHFQKELQGIFGNNSIKEFLHFGSLNLKIREKAKERLSQEYSGAIRTVLLEGLTLQILGLQLAACQDFFNADIIPKELSRIYITNIERCKNYILDNLSENLTLRFLSHKFSIPIHKLQLGFKHFFGSTVNNFIHDRRLIKAADLIENTDKNLKEICYEIGYESRSYFSKSFKKKFHVKPSEYSQEK